MLLALSALVVVTAPSTLTPQFALHSRTTAPAAHTQSLGGPKQAAPAARVKAAAPRPHDGAVKVDESLVASLKEGNRSSFELPVDGGEVWTLRFHPIDVLTSDATLLTATRDATGVITTAPLQTSMQAYAIAVDGRSDARGVLTLSEDIVGGFVSIPGRTIWISNGPLGRNLPTVSFDAERAHPSFLPVGGHFCDADLLPTPAGPQAPAQGGVAGGSPNACREVSIAIDTDWEFTNTIFAGNTNAAAAYALALTAAASEIYTDDLNVRLRVSYLRLWTGANGASDPWDQGSTANQLFQYRDYWVANESAVPRDLGHFLSGRGLGGGVAWLPGLCGGDFAFGLSANLGGFFPYPLQDNSGANWDIMVYTHELGHNFGAPHTHNYEPPLDGCGLGDCSQANTGTIMSYCHLCSGGLANVALNFHPANVATMSEFLNTTSCDFSGEAMPADAMDDYLTAAAGQSVTIDLLFNDERVNCESISLTSFPQTTVNGAPILVVPTLPGNRPLLSVTIPASATLDDSFTYSITDSGGSTDTGTVFLDVLPLLPATNVVGATPKLDAGYYEIGNLSLLPDFTQLTPYLTGGVSQVNFPSTNGNFAASGRADFVGAVFEGWIDIATSGFYTFFVESDDGSRLLIDGLEVVDNDGLHGMVERSGVIGLLPGKHAFRVEFFEAGGGAGVIARVQGPGLSKQVIPGSMLSSGGFVPGPDLNNDGVVDAADLALLLGAWGSNDPSKDQNGDGTIDAADLAVLLGAWG